MSRISTPGVLAILIGLVLVGVAAPICRANPRDQIVFTNARLDDPIFAPPTSISRVTVAASYQVRYLTLTGTFATDPGADLMYAGGLTVSVSAPNGEQVVLHPFTASPLIGTASIAPVLVYRLPHDFASVGTWTGVVDYSLSGNRHAQWSTLTVSLNDGPPVVPTNPIAFPAPTEPLAVVGNIGSPGVHLVNQALPAGGALWYRFDVPVPIATFSTGFFPFSAYLDIDTEGAAISSSIALFDTDGRLLVTDYFSGSLGGGGQGQFSFGTAPTRPGVGNAGLDYNNRNGTLAPGVYYLAVSRFTAQYSSGWAVSNTGAAGGAMHVNFATNISSSPTCPADFNRSGTVSLQDLFDFLTAWFGGC